MIDVNCNACGKHIAVNEALAGKKGRCPKCAATVIVPGAVAALGRASQTATAVQQVLAVLDAKETVTKPTQRRTLVPSRSQKKWAIGAAVVAAVLAIGYLIFTPDRWESEHRSAIVMLKQQADQLATEGKPEQAYARYGEIVRYAAGRAFKDSSVRRAVDDAKAARTTLHQQLQLASSRSRLAGSAQ